LRLGTVYSVKTEPKNKEAVMKKQDCKHVGIMRGKVRETRKHVDTTIRFRVCPECETVIETAERVLGDLMKERGMRLKEKNGLEEELRYVLFNIGRMKDAVRTLNEITEEKEGNGESEDQENGESGRFRDDSDPYTHPQRP